MARFIYALDGTAINVDHIVTIFTIPTSKGDGFVVRCRTTLASGEFVGEHQVLNLSGVLAEKEDAQLFIDTIVRLLLNPPTEASA